LPAGFSLLETVFALMILLVVAAGVLPMGVMATKTSENQGHLVARTTEYAQDKMEQLMALAYGDSISDTRVFPTSDTGGSGLTIGGSSDPAAPVNLYVDYLDMNGNLFAAGGAAPANWYYMRVWQVSQPRANLKQISVTVTVRTSALGGLGSVPRSTVTALKSAPF
jgi:hypothetical protein